MRAVNERDYKQFYVGTLSLFRPSGRYGVFARLITRLFTVFDTRYGLRLINIIVDLRRSRFLFFFFFFLYVFAYATNPCCVTFRITADRCTNERVT